MKKLTTKLIFVCAMVAGLSVAASAQKGGKNDQKKPRPPAPVINPAPPKPKDDKPKKPRGGAEAFVLVVRAREDTV